jgi:NAD(P)-dependent dehydrogenase (short-subunit alcohol dehydrogenase family)
MSAEKTKIAVITGATDGMGRVVAPLLAKAGYFVVVHGRSEKRGKVVVDEILEGGGQGRFVACNLASLEDIRRFVGDLNAEYDHIDVLINNAGIGTGPDGAPREESVDGLELHFAVNYLACFLLTRLVLGKVKTAAPARIINVASAGQEPLDFSNLQLERDYSGYFAYCRSKVALIMFTFDLAEELKDTGVTVNAMHPGAYMNTTMVREMKHGVVDSIDEGANFVLELATSAKFDGVTGRYIDRGVDTRAKGQCYDREVRKKLREISNKLAAPRQFLDPLGL